MQPDWEIWLDNHLSSAIARWIIDELGFSAKSSYVLQLEGLDDLDIFRRAHDAGNIILITKDADFEVLVRQFGAPPKVINITIGNTDNRALWNWLKQRLPKAMDLLLNLDFDFIQID